MTCIHCEGKEIPDGLVCAFCLDDDHCECTDCLEGTLEFQVTWVAGVLARDARQAAERALAMQQNPDSIATVFDVTLPSGKQVQVDLSVDDEAANQAATK